MLKSHVFICGERLAAGQGVCGGQKTVDGALSSHHLGPRNRTGLVRFGGRFPEPLNHLTRLDRVFKVAAFYMHVQRHKGKYTSSSE